MYVYAFSEFLKEFRSDNRKKKKRNFFSLAYKIEQSLLRYLVKINYL